MDSENSRADRLGRRFKVLCAMRHIKPIADRIGRTDTDTRQESHDPAAGAWGRLEVSGDRIRPLEPGKHLQFSRYYPKGGAGAGGLGLLPGRISKNEQKGKV